MKVLRSSNLGKTFTETKAAPAFPKDDGRALANIWSLEPGDSKKELWCGTEPAALFRSENGGGSWTRLGRGLPKKESYFTVLRDAMDADELQSSALYFGTTTGQLWIGREGGEQWECLFDSLPPIHCVKVAVV